MADAPVALEAAAQPQSSVKNKSKGKAQNANGKATSRTAMIQESRSRVFTFAICVLRFAF